MNNKRTILVTGATGAQGGSVARHLLAEGRFAVRCLTRNPKTGEALELQQAGAEIVKGNLDDKASLLTAMQDIYGVFGVTNFWEHFEKEYGQGKNLIEAAAETGVDHFIYSSLPSAEKTSLGRFKVPHFDGKAELQEYAAKLIPGASFVHVAGYYENFASVCLPQKADDGNYYLQLPQGDTKYASLCVEDLGGIICSMFNFPAVYKGRTVGAVGADMPCDEYAAIMRKVLGINIFYRHISQKDFAALDFAGAEELANMYAFNKMYITQRTLDLIESYGLYPSMQPFEKWLLKNKNLFEQALQLQAELIG